MAAPERFADRSDSPCTAGAVHTWPIATNSSFGPDVSFWGEAEVGGRQSSLPRSKLTQLRHRHCSTCPCLAYDVLRAHGAALIYQFCKLIGYESYWTSGRQTRVNRGRVLLRVWTTELWIAAGLSTVQTPMIT